MIGGTDPRIESVADRHSEPRTARRQEFSNGSRETCHVADRILVAGEPIRYNRTNALATAETPQRPPLSGDSGGHSL